MNNKNAMGQDYGEDGTSGTIKIGSSHYTDEKP